MGSSDDLIRRSVSYAHEIADLLNRTITHGIRMSALLDQKSHCWVAHGISKSSMLPSLIPVALGRGSSTCYIDVAHRLRFDPEGIHLADVKTRYAVHRVPGADPWFRYEYVRDNAPHPEVHLHVEAAPTEALPSGVRPLPKQHLPLGNRRFRLALEDVIEFLIREKYADAHDGWEAVLDEHRAKWHRMQLGAAVRRDPATAAAALRSEGFDVSPP